jgi:hypothetical protein
LSILRRFTGRVDEVCVGTGGLETDLGTRLLLLGSFDVDGVGIGFNDDDEVNEFFEKLIEFFGGGSSDSKLLFFEVPVRGTYGFFVSDSSSESP